MCVRVSICVSATESGRGWMYARICACVWVSSVCASVCAGVCVFVLDFIWFCVALGIYLPTPRHAVATPLPLPIPAPSSTNENEQKTSFALFLLFFSFCFCSVQREKSWFRNSFREFVKRIVLNAFSNNSIELGTRVLPAPLSRLSQVACSRSLFVFLFPCFYTSGEREQRR